MDRVRSELLINHVNYFDPTPLRSQLESLNFELKDWFVYNLKTFYRGAGWRLIDIHKARISERKSAAKTIAQSASLESTFKKATVSAIPRAYGVSLLKPLLMLYCWIKHMPFIRVSPSARIGEEIYCLAQKIK